MAFTLTTTQAGASADYEKYLWIDGQRPTKTDSKGQPTLLDFALVAWGPDFVKLTRGAYIVLDSDKYPKFFTGYITYEPELEYLGYDNSHQPVWGYKYQATSDEYILNLNPIGLSMPFLNQTMGAILRQLAVKLQPGPTLTSPYFGSLFNLTQIQEGPTVAQYTPDPQAKFSDIVEEFTKAANYSFWASNNTLYFVPQDDGVGSGPTPVTLDGNITNIAITMNVTANFAPPLVAPFVIQLGSEYILVTGTGGGLNWNISRGRFGSTAVAHTGGASIGYVTALGSFTLDKNDLNFTPTELSVSPSQTPIINDCIALGDIEPQLYMQEYFIGTGLDSAFDLAASVFGADNSVFIKEDFSSNAIDTETWVVQDVPGSDFTVTNSYLNILGGSGDISEVYLASKNLIPLEANLRLTHGEWDFISGEGIFASLWTQTPNDAYTGLVYGLSMIGSTIVPVVNGTPDLTQAYGIDTGKRYIFRTIASFTRHHRATQKWSFITSAGVVNTLGGRKLGDTGNFNTILTEVDPATGLITNQFQFDSSGVPLNATTDLYATYVPIASSSMHATVSGITVSIPVNAALETYDRTGLVNLGFERWADIQTPIGWKTPINSFQETVFSYSGSALKIQVDKIGYGALDQDASASFLADTKYNISIRAQRSLATTKGTLTVRLLGTGVNDDTDTELLSPGLSINIGTEMTSDYQLYTGVLTNKLRTPPDDLILRIEITGSDEDEIGAIWVDSIIIESPYVKHLVGPNEIDSMDGLAPYATIVSGSLGAKTTSNFLGSNQFNPGQDQLVFFKDSVTRTSNQPPVNHVIHLSYRSAGIAVGRAQSAASIAAEATAWGDNGLRTVVRDDFSPRPRNAYECELAAGALVSENDFPHYGGSYLQWSDYFAVEPRSGGILTFANMIGTATGLMAEEVQEVVTTIESKTPIERFRHNVTFGKPDVIQRFLAKFESIKGTFQKNADQSLNPAGIDLADIDTAYGPDVTSPFLVDFDESFLYFNTGQDLDGDASGFEVRYTDKYWGTGATKNLVVAPFGGRTFQVPRSDRGRTVFIRQVMNSGAVSRYSACLHVAFPTPLPIIGPTQAPQASFIFGRDAVTNGPANIIAGGSSNKIVVRKGGTMTGWDAIMEEAATGSAATFDVQLNGVSIFGTNLVTIPVSTTTRVSGASFTGRIVVEPGDVLQGFTIAVGSSTPGKSATIQLYWE